MVRNNFKALNPTSIRNYTMVKPAGMMSNRYKLEEMPDLSGKVAVVTGGSRGIGEAAVSALVQKGCKGEFTSQHLIVRKAIDLQYTSSPLPKTTNRKQLTTSRN